MQTLLSARLAAARRNRFVGRTAECELFGKAIRSESPAFQILYLFGPGGVGKTTLLHEFSAIAHEATIEFTYFDARELQPSPAEFEQSLQAALDPATTSSPSVYLGERVTRHVIAIDTYEKISALDGWMRNAFLPSLPESVMVVIAGRTPPTMEWRSDPGWKEVTQIRPVRNFSPDESKSYLERRNAPAEQIEQLVQFTHGHPLALSLIADAIRQRPDADLNPSDAPDVIRSLVERFVEDVPSPAHRVVLEACSLLRVVNEALLAALIEEETSEQISHLFDWLQGISFIDLSPRGLFLHDLAREALHTELLWRNPDRYQQLRERARRYYIALLEQQNHPNQQRNLSDYLFLFRQNDTVRSFFKWQETGAMIADQVRNDEVDTVTGLVATVESADSAQIFRYWREKQPRNTIAVRDLAGTIQGLLQLVVLNETSPADRSHDPAVLKACQYLESQVRLRQGEQATFFRFWLDRNHYQNVSLVQSQLFLLMMQHYLATPGLAFSFIPCAEPKFWASSFVYASLRRLPQLDFTVGERTFGVFTQDWRTLSPLSWLKLLGEWQLAGEPITESSGQSVNLLSEEEFAEALKNALRDFHATAQLRNNPLLHSRMLTSRVESKRDGNVSDSERIKTLRQIIQETAAILQLSPKQMSFYRTLYHTYLQPAATQSAASELLDLPFSTYRRHLRSGIEFLIDQLWAIETGEM